MGTLTHQDGFNDANETVIVNPYKEDPARGHYGVFDKELNQKETGAEASIMLSGSSESRSSSSSSRPK